MTESVDWGQGWTQTGCLRGGGGRKPCAGGGGEYERDGPPTHTHSFERGPGGISPLIRGGLGDLPIIRVRSRGSPPVFFLNLCL